MNRLSRPKLSDMVAEAIVDLITKNDLQPGDRIPTEKELSEQLGIGKTSLRAYGFIGDVRLVVPEGIGVSVASSALISDARVLGRKTDTFLGTFYWESEGFVDDRDKLVGLLRGVYDIPPREFTWTMPNGSVKTGDS